MARYWSRQQYDEGDAAGSHESFRAGRRVEVPAVMIDFIAQAIRTLTLFGQEALTGGNVWILMLIVIIAAGAVATMRGKLTDSWLWIPVLALAMWYAVYRWLEIRA